MSELRMIINDIQVLQLLQGWFTSTISVSSITTKKGDAKTSLSKSYSYAPLNIMKIVTKGEK